jgi:glycosyltransferase involved in cell wall biosynthesis
MTGAERFGQPMVHFSIITPSFRGSQWLRLCIASVADQGIDHEHLVQDAGSDDGTLDWLLADTRVNALVEQDRGMYDAVNRGLRRAKGDLLAYLNCDEQYLPGTLQRVAEYFDSHPGIDIAFADTVVVDPEGRFLSLRQCSLPQRYHSWVSGNLSILTCSTFFRRSLIDRHGLFFNPELKDLGDAEWVLRLLDLRIRAGVLRHCTSAFTITGANMNSLPNAARERRELLASAPLWARKARAFIVLHYRLRRLLAGHYWPTPFGYAIYTRVSPDRRVGFDVPAPTFRWRR